MKYSKKAIFAIIAVIIASCVIANASAITSATHFDLKNYNSAVRSGAAQVYIGDVILSHDSTSVDNCYTKLTNLGYTPVKFDLNKGTSGQHIALGYKTTTSKSTGIAAITFTYDEAPVSSLKCNEFSGKQYQKQYTFYPIKATDSSGAYNINSGNSSAAIYGYYTKEDCCDKMSKIILKSAQSYNNYTAATWANSDIQANLNMGNTANGISFFYTSEAIMSSDTDTSTDSSHNTTTDTSTDSSHNTTTDTSTDSSHNTTTDTSTDSSHNTTTDTSTDSSHNTTTDTSTDTGKDTASDSANSDPDTNTDSQIDTESGKTSDTQPNDSENDTSDTSNDTSTDSAPDTEAVHNSDTETEKDKPTDTEPNTSIMYGDINGDYKVNMEDVVLQQKYIAKLVGFTEEQKTAADVNRDNSITMLDVTTTQKFIAQLIKSFI